MEEDKFAEGVALLRQILVQRPNSAAVLYQIAILQESRVVQDPDRPLALVQQALADARAYDAVLKSGADPTWFSAEQIRAALSEQQRASLPHYDPYSLIRGLETDIWRMNRNR